MDFFRSLLAGLRLAYVPKVNAKYRYTLEGPFTLGPILVPVELKDGFVRYEIRRPDEPAVEVACPYGTFAHMCREVA